MDSITVTVINWGKYNPRKDYKTPFWFALSNRVLEDPDLFELDPIEFKAFIYILCQVSQKKGESASIRFTHADRVSNLKPKALKSAIEKLVRLGIITANEELTREDSNSRTKNKTEQYDTDATNMSDFDEIYKNYPRHEGKAVGHKRLVSRNYDEPTLELFANSVDGYSMKTRHEKTDLKFIKLWATFIGTGDNEPWRDFIDWAPPIEITETKEERIARMVREREGKVS